MIIGTGQKLSCCEACALTLFLDDKKLEQAQEEPLLGLNIDPILSCLNCVTNLRKKLSLKIKIKYHIILFNASIKSILEYFVSVWASCNAGLLYDTF